MTSSSGPTCRIVVQQCMDATLAFDTDDKPVTISWGMVVFVCFLQGATTATASHVAKSILQTRLTEPKDSEGSSRKSCLELFPECSVLLIPQATLGGKLKGKQCQYHGLVDKTLGSELFSQVATELKQQLSVHCRDESLPAVKVQAGIYGARQILSMNTNGPFTHVFEFDIK